MCVFHIDICAGFDQQLNYFRIDLPDASAQRGLAIFGVDICGLPEAALCSGFVGVTPPISLAFTSAPAEISSWHISDWLFEAALCKGTSPLLSLALTTAPTDKRCRASSTWPYHATWWSGTWPRSYLALTSAPAAINAHTVSESPSLAASYRFVVPSFCIDSDRSSASPRASTHDRERLALPGVDAWEPLEELFD